MSMKKRYDFDFDKHEVSDFLRALATSIDNDQRQVEGYDVHLPNYHKLKITVKHGEDNLRLKLKLKHYETAEEEDEEYSEMRGREKYKNLKKRMKAYYKELGDSVQAGDFPSREIVSVFLKDSESMITYDDMGDEFYEDYRLACQEFGQAFEAEDFDRFARAFEQVAALKDRCHGKYKD
jgi:XXXCH domain-containing protein